MAEKFRNKYRIKFVRCPYWEYGSNAAYFITICTKNRKHYFGEISDNKMNMTEIGEMAEKYWHEIPEHFPFVKPKNKFGPQSKNLASIVRGYKTGTKKFATMNQVDFTWQPRFHDHIIQNDKSYNRIRNYIINNPKNWKGDKFHD